MKKLFFALPVSLIAIGLQVQAMPVAGQTAQATSNNASAQADNANVRTVQATQLKAELTKQVDSKHAKVGDKVLARTTSPATLANGMKLPRGTKLMGKVTDVQAKSHAHQTSHLAFAFDQAVLKHGQTIPIRAVLTSVSVPSAIAAENAEGGMGAGPAGGGGMAGGGAMAGPPPTAGAGGATAGANGVAGGAGSVTENTATQTGAMADNTLDSTNNAASSAGHVVNNGTSVSGPVAGLRGVTFSSSIHSNDSAQMSAKGENISLGSGTQMTMAVIADNAGASTSGSPSMR